MGHISDRDNNDDDNKRMEPIIFYDMQFHPSHHYKRLSKIHIDTI